MLYELVHGRRAATIADVVEIMTALDQELSKQDGLWWFNLLYLRVTLAVGTAVTTTTYRDPAFIERLDVVFANLYFDAVAAGNTNPGTASAAWRPLFECRHQSDILPIQFALAGMNAHINRDLPVGVVATYRATDGAPARDGDRYDDFNKVNDLLELVETQIKAEFSTGIVALIDAAGGNADDVVAMWKVREARETAWTNAEVLWALRAVPVLRDKFFSRLDSFTGFAGRGLLLRPITPTPIQIE
jgi:hypothetical protein